MNFYDQQSSKRWHSALLLLAFALVLLCLGGLIHVVITALSLALGQGGSFTHPSDPAMVMIALVWATMVAGSAFRLMDVKAGGAVLARRFGAVNASGRSRHENERQLLNVVAEVAIASSTAQPDVYVLRGEDSINALLLGNRNRRPVIVVTEGALDAFDREQLQAVVAHEFAHIVNGDLPLNMRLLVAMGGLMAIDEVGRLLIPKDSHSWIHPGMIIGYIVCSLGKVGVISGQLISAAFSRQREYLADATAVQFTRQPYALASALDVIRENNYHPALHGVHARELAYLCFQTGTSTPWFGRVLATHPDIDLRINAVEPHFDVKKRKIALRDAVALSSNVSPISSVSMGGILAVNSDPGISYDAAVTTEAAPQTAALSDRIVLLLHDQSSCVAALFAMFIHENADQKRKYFDALASRFNDKFADKVKHVMQQVPEELANDQLGIITHASSVLIEQLSDEHRLKITRTLEQLLDANGNYQLMDYARVQLIRRKLKVEFPVIRAIANESQAQAQASKVKNFDSMGSEFALLLSLMVESSGASPKDLDEQFQRVLSCYTLENHPRRTATEIGIIKELETAFQTLYIQPQSIRRAFVQHCFEIMHHDGYIMPSERALLDLFAASLRCEELIAA